VSSSQAKLNCGLRRWRGIDGAVDDVFRRHQDRLEGMATGEDAVEEMSGTSPSEPGTIKGSSIPARSRTRSYARACSGCGAGVLRQPIQ
jgi:hypothetical protein